MANRFPLIIDPSTNRIVELPAIDNLDLSGSDISSVANITSNGVITATSFSGDGANLTGIVATVAQTVSNAAQPNITSVGNLTTLVVTGNANITNTNLVKFGETVVNGGNANGTITPDAAAGTIYNYTLTGNITLDSLGNAVAGTSMTIILTQDGTGNRAMSSTMKFAANSKTLSTSANTTDILGVFYDGTTYYASLTKGYV
jgi:hypothetical protein